MFKKTMGKRKYMQNFPLSPYVYRIWHEASTFPVLPVAVGSG